MFVSTRVWPTGWYCPPITPNGITARPPLVASAGILHQNARLVGNDGGGAGMSNGVDEGADVAVLVDHADVDRRRVHRRRDLLQVEHPVHADLAGPLLGEFFAEDSGDI